MKLNFIAPLRKIIPEVKTSDKIPSMSERLTWVGLALVIYFLMYNTIAVGVRPITEFTGELNFLSAVTAANLGSLITTGIGPIVLASIFLQLFSGAKIIDVDMNDSEERKNYFTFQKTLAIVLALVEALFFTVGQGFFALHTPETMGMLGAAGELPIIIMVTLQLAFGSIILMYLDEIIQKRGIGSGISLFIAAGVSFMVLMLGLGLITESFEILMGATGAGAEAIPMALAVLAPLLSTVLVFLVVVYAESLKVDIPLVFGKLRGMDTVHSIPLLYVSNIPVILTAALLMNVQVVGTVFPTMSQEDMPAGDDFIANIIEVAQKNPLALLVYNVGLTSEDGTVRPQMVDGLFSLFTPQGIVPGYKTKIDDHINHLLTGYSPIFKIPLLIHLTFYIGIYVILSIIFGMFWVETSGMTSKDVSMQLFQYGLHIPGMRRDPRIIEMTLNKFIPTITILGSAFVGFLAAFANITGALGTGTGILLTVMILHRLYQQLDQMGAFRYVPILGTIFGTNK
ncbi:hypothetical protein KO465_03525 [Candidatus Micrarchaeota archaeon]|nr:hypothetical protein [Candidatus Micrarchaeota archaeon]